MSNCLFTPHFSFLGSDTSYFEEKKRRRKEAAWARLLFRMRLPFPGAQELACAGEVLYGRGDAFDVSRAVSGGVAPPQAEVLEQACMAMIFP
jgi:hypothetical protein